MIGKLRGIVDVVGLESAIVDVSGVGYEVFCSSRTLSSMPSHGEPIALSIDTHVREDVIRLYGFSSESERGWFRLLQSVQGVGAKVALAILSTLDVQTLANAIAVQDKAAVTRAPGVGPKVALRIVNELKDKAPLMTPSTASVAMTSASAPHVPTPPSPTSDAISALINLGYAPLQANAAISAVMAQAGDTPKAETLIRLGLKELSRPV